MNDRQRRPGAPLGQITLMAACAAAGAAGAQEAEEGHLHGSATQHQPIAEIEVVTTVLDRTLLEVTQGTTVLEGDELSRSLSNTIGETLSMQPGVTASYFGPGSSRPIIRGLAGGRVRVMQDGISTLDVSTVSVDHAVGLEPLLVERVEILRGPNTLLYGSGAVGGVVNTISTRLPTDLPVDGLEGGFEVRGDTVADERSGAFTLNGNAGRLVWHLDGALRETGDYSIPGAAEIDEDDDGPEAGTLENSDLESSAWGAGLTWVGDNAFLGFAVSGFDTNYGIPGHHHHHGEEEHGEHGEHDEDHGHDEHDHHDEDHDHDHGEGGEENVRIDLEQVRVDVKGGWYASGGFIDSVMFRAGYNDYAHVELEGDEVGTRFGNDAFEGRVEVTHRTLGAWQGVFGIQYEEREFSAIGAEAFVPPVDTAALGAFVVEDADFGDWQLSLGARAELQESDPSNGPTVDDTAFSFSAGAVRLLGERDAIAFNLSVAQRLPNAEELFANGPHLATRSFEIGDPGLGVETSRHGEIGWRHDGDRFGFNLAGFFTSFGDYIYLAPTGATEDGLPVFQWLQADAEFTGIEAEARTTLATLGRGDLDARVFGDWVAGELSDGDNLPLISPGRLGGRLEYHDDVLAAGLETVHVFEQDNVADFETPTDGYTMLNADFSWAVSFGEAVSMDLFLRASNLLDEEARRHVSFIKDLAPLPGRNVTFGIRGRF